VAHCILAEWSNKRANSNVGVSQVLGARDTKENAMATMVAPAKGEQLTIYRRSSACWRVTIGNPPINVMGPEMVKQLQTVIHALEADQDVRVVAFDSSVDDYFLNHSDFLAKIEDLTGLPDGPTVCRPGRTFWCD
jgi:hypothetical protein